MPPRSGDQYDDERTHQQVDARGDDHWSPASTDAIYEQQRVEKEANAIGGDTYSRQRVFLVSVVDNTPTLWKPHE